MSNRSSWIILAVAVVLVGALSVIASGQSTGPASMDVSSSKPDGALALYRWLRRAGYRVRTETDADLGLGQLQPKRDTVMLFEQDRLTAERASSLLEWVRGGGRLVLAVGEQTDDASLRRLQLSVQPAFPGEVTVEQPLLLAPSVTVLSGAPAEVVTGTFRDVVVASTYAGPILLHRAAGSGHIWFLSAPELLNNGSIAQVDNRRLLLNLAGPLKLNAQSPGRRTVAFEQPVAAPAPAGSQVDWLTETNWGIALLFAVAVLVLYRWSSGLYLGPPINAIDDRRRPATEYVISMAGLLRRAHRRAEILAQYQHSLRRALHDRFGTADITELEPEERAKLDRLLDSPDTLSEEALVRLAGEIVQYEENVRRTRGA